MCFFLELFIASELGCHCKPLVSWSILGPVGLLHMYTTIVQFAKQIGKQHPGWPGMFTLRVVKWLKLGRICIYFFDFYVYIDLYLRMRVPTTIYNPVIIPTDSAGKLFVAGQFRWGTGKKTPVHRRSGQIGFMSGNILIANTCIRWDNKHLMHSIMKPFELVQVNMLKFPFAMSWNSTSMKYNAKPQEHERNSGGHVAGGGSVWDRHGVL